jgi:hypothetical protein
MVAGRTRYHLLPRERREDNGYTGAPLLADGAYGLAMALARTRPTRALDGLHVLNATRPAVNLRWALDGLRAVRPLPSSERRASPAPMPSSKTSACRVPSGQLD